MTATDTATEVVADVAEEVAEQALDVADAARGASGHGLGLAFGAFLVGAGVGGGLAFVLAKRQLTAKYEAIANEEIEAMREHYRSKAVALESEAAKRPVEEIVKERGYSSPDAKTTSPPMAVSPPQQVVDNAEEAKETLKDARPEAAEVVERNVFEEHGVEDEWNPAEERKLRSPDIPYVIHYDERDEMDYQVTTLTYYEGDDVVCNERDEIMGPEDRNRVVGEKNLEKFGHGSNDPNVVYVRNDKLELVFEVVRSPNSYAEEVAGFRHTDYARGNLERMRTREREQRDDDG